MRSAVLILATGSFLALVGTPAIGGDVEHGKQLYLACAGCHTDKPNALGPSLRGVFGRKSAALEDYRYSAPMQRANLIWDETNLREYIADPQSKVKGNRMPYGGLKDPKDIDDVVAYLKTFN
jgi:cytochrome c